MGAFLCFMAVRLLEMHRVLKSRGSIYLHCDPTASHYLKAIMDAVFGWKNFKNEIVWRRSATHNAADKFGPNHDVILFYAMPDYTHTIKFFPYLLGYVEEYFTKVDDKGRYRGQELHGSGIRKGASGKPWRGFDPTAMGRHWAVPSKLVLSLGIDPDLPQHEKLDVLYKMGFIDLNSSYMPQYRQYLTDSPGVPLQDVWAYQPYTKGLLRGTGDEIDKNVRWIPDRDKKERVGFPTQKPIGLYERIIESSSKTGGIVLDPFCGCATTCIAAEKLQRRWVGIDIWDKAHEVVLQRLETEGLIASGRDKRHGHLFAEDVIFTADPPVRTDDGEIAVPYLNIKERTQEPKESPMKRSAMFAKLIVDHGLKCNGCDRLFDDPRYLELDHRLPRSEGGPNELSNRILLCSPCNRLKSNTLTLTGLRRQNKKLSYMAHSEGEHPIMRKYRLEHANTTRDLFE